MSPRPLRFPERSGYHAAVLGTETRLRLGVVVPFAALFLSGAAGLVYEVVWSRAVATLFGSVLTATGSLLALFMAGLGLGSAVAGRWVGRLRRPLLAFGVVEVAVGALAATTPELLRGAAPLVARLDVHFPDPLAPLVPAVVSLVVLGPVVVLLGTTFPLFLAHAERGRDRLAEASGWVYGLNTLGAVAGTLAAGFLLLPALGIGRTLLVAAATDIAVGVLCMAIGRSALLVGETPTDPSPAAAGNPGLAVGVALLGGAAALTLEVAWFRALMLIFGSSVHALSLMLAAFLLGLAGGAVLLGRRSDRADDHLAVLGTYHLLIAFSATMVTVLLQVVPALFIPLLRWSGGSFTVVAFGSLVLLLALLLAPTTLMGAALPLAIRVGAGGVSRGAGAAGRVYAASSLGSSVGALAAGFLLVPRLGLRGAVAVAAALSLAACYLALVRSSDRRRRRQALQAAGLTVAVWLAWAVGVLPWEWRVLTAGYYAYAHLYAGAREAADGPVRREVRLDQPHPFPGGGSGATAETPTRADTEPRLLYWEEGAFAQVAVVEDGGVRSLLINGKADASSGAGDMRTQLLLAHLPVLLAPGEPGGEALVIGLGSGVTAGGLAAWPYAPVTVAEIEPAVVRASRWFSEWNGGVLGEARVTVRTDDGRRVLDRSRSRLALVTSEPSNLWMSGVTLLFTREFFDLVASRLEPGGVVCQWLHLYQVGPDDVRCLLRTMSGAFRHVLAFADGSDLLLVAAQEPLQLDPAVWQRRLAANPRAAASLARAGVGSGLGLAAGFVADEGGIVAFSRGAELHTDDRPLLEFSAARQIARDRSGAILAALVRAGEAAGPIRLGAAGEVGAGAEAGRAVTVAGHRSAIKPAT
jgi:spermidine synthase